ncbi:MAG TPA: hypothetical protein VN851_04230 [Thermoanaerobaculia bacterium]|nr:hypothetical protein [Thermoanaerobaculia bacterium]
MFESLALWLWLSASPRSAPLATDFQKISGEQRAVTLALIREETTMGDPRPVLITEGTLISDEPSLYCLPPSSGAEFQPEGTSGTRLCVVQMGFSLDPPEGPKKFRRVGVRMELTTASLRLHDFYPRSLKVPADRRHSLAVSLGGAQFLSVPLMASRPGIFSVEDLEPVIIGRRQSGSKVAWEFRGPEDAAVGIGPRRIFALIGVPEGGRTVEGTLRYEADFENLLFGKVWIPETARTRKVSFKLALDGREGRRR